MAKLDCAGPVENYLQSFQWNKVKYRADKPIAELVDILQKVGANIPRPRQTPD